jgi:ATP-binding cassette subfamily B protein
MLLSIVQKGIFIPLSAAAAALLPKAAIDAVINDVGTARTLATIGAYAAVIVAADILSNGLSYITNSVMNTKVMLALRNDVYVKAIGTDFKYCDNPEFFSQFTYAQEQIASVSLNAYSSVFMLLIAVSSVAAMGAIIASMSPPLILLSLVFVVLQTVLELPVAKASVNITAELSDKSRFMSYVARCITQKENSAELRSSGAGEKMLRVFRASSDSIVRSNTRFYKRIMRFSIPQTGITSLQGIVILTYIVIFIIAGDASKIGLYASLTVAAASLTSYTSQIFSIIPGLFRQTLEGEKIAAFFEAESVIEPPDPNAVPAPGGVYSVELHDIAFGYENSAFGIKGFNLTVKPGQRVAIVGENGAGKSTLTKLLLRLYDVGGGKILINGRDIRDYDVHALRRHIGIAYQDVRILAMSLRDNLTVYNDATDEELLRVIDRLGLQSVLEKAGGNLDVQISREFTEDGVVLSGGEAQRVALARLFTGAFGLLLLDEPSSALDPLAEYNLMQVILDKSNTATTIMIAHRLSTVRNFDIIYHVENGEIIESGTHDELIAAQGKYYEMFTRQGENYNN